MKRTLASVAVILGLVGSGCSPEAMDSERSSVMGSAAYDAPPDAAAIADADGGSGTNIDASLASCAAGETLVAGVANCSYSVNAAAATGQHTAYSVSVDDPGGSCFCYLDANCRFNDKSTVCAGGSLARGETYPCSATLTGTSWTLLKSWTSKDYTPATPKRCDELCTIVYDGLSLTAKNNYALTACQGIVPASTKVDPISCCIADTTSTQAPTW